jgi:hypothetical protein
MTAAEMCARPETRRAFLDLQSALGGLVGSLFAAAAYEWAPFLVPYVITGGVFNVIMAWRACSKAEARAAPEGTGGTE